MGVAKEEAGRVGVGTQEGLAYETDLTATADPLAGSYAIETMTSEIEQEAGQLIAKVEELGGAVAAIEQGFQKTEIERSAYQIARQVDAGERVVVGVNRFAIAEEEPYQPLRVDPGIARDQADRLAALPATTHSAGFTRRIAAPRRPPSTP